MPWVRNVVSSGKENQEDTSGVNKDCAVSGWLLGCGVWSVGGVLRDRGIPDVSGGMQSSAVIWTT